MSSFGKVGDANATWNTAKFCMDSIVSRKIGKGEWHFQAGSLLLGDIVLSY